MVLADLQGREAEEAMASLLSQYGVARVVAVWRGAE